MIGYFLRLSFYALVVQPIVLVILGLRVRRRELLPEKGPAILVANHNSHLDTMVVSSLLTWRLLPRLRPVAAADYFMRNPVLKWFSLTIVGIIPLARRPKHGVDPLEGCARALESGDILLIYPEGSRGEPEQRSRLKTGVAHLAKRHPDVPVVPLYMYGLGKALPRGEALLVPFFCDVFVGEAVNWTGDKTEFMAALEGRMAAMAKEGGFDEYG